MDRLLTGLMVVALVATAGCATTPVSFQQSSPGTYNPAMPKQLLTKTPGTGTLVVIRDRGFLGSGCKEVVSVDAQEVGYVHTAQELTVYLPAGQHEMYVEMGEHSICGIARNSAIFTITPENTIIMDIHLSQNGGLTITPQNIGNNSTDY